MSVRVGVIGTGWGARVQVPAFRAAGLEVAALWGHTRDQAQRVAGELGVPFATADWRELVARDDLDLVSVTTPPATHCEIAVGALAAGRHVLCEKPTALDAGEAETMLAAARRHPDRLALIDHELRFVPARRELARQVADGFVGRVTALEGTVWGSQRLDPSRDWSWWSDAARGGGILGALGSHLVDFFTWVTGLEIEAVCGVLDTRVRERPDADGRLRPVTSDDAVQAHLRLAGGALGLLHLDATVATPPVHRVRVTGTEGTLVYEGERLTGRRLEDGDRGEAPQLAGRETLALPAGLRDDDFARGTVHLGRSLAASLGAEPGPTAAAGEIPAPLADAATFADGLAVQRVLDAIRRSDALGEWVEVAPVPRGARG